MPPADGEETSRDGKCTHYHDLNDQVVAKLASESELEGLVLTYDRTLPNRTRRGGTYVLGTFTCASANCDKSWFSGRVYTEFFYRRSGHVHEFDVIVWGQKCRKCKQIAVAALEEDTYYERVSSKLLLFMDLRDAIARSGDERTTPPYRKELCCACQAGKCVNDGES